MVFKSGMFTFEKPALAGAAVRFRGDVGPRPGRPRRAMRLRTFT